MKKYIEAIIQARMGSMRLPEKVMMDLCGKPVLWHIIERVKQSKLINNIVVATSMLKKDDIIYKYLKKLDINCFRGNEMDVLSRYYYALKQYPADAVIRITADCPLIDPHIIDKVIYSFINNNCEYASNIGEERKFPRGLDCEIFTCNLLEKAFDEATEDYEREHVTPFMYIKNDRILNIENEEDYSNMRWTLDTIEDFQMIKAVYNHFYKGTHDFYMKDIYSFVKNHPGIYNLNCHIKQKQLNKEGV